ncbi:MAG: tryptophan--tRNA ligase, partial [Candidatus Pacebacteria bacterium]|nr:tryptophan--tRNA ligase [Candidatus Paceibacterota bacterium]
VLQAADILMYKADAVPVGQDQIQHIELTRKIARFFNNKFCNTFPEPKNIITETSKIMSLTNPTKKMSKSHGPKSYIGINDKPEIIQKKMRKAVSTTEYNKDIYNFYATLLKKFGSEKNKRCFNEKLKNQDIKFSELKNALAEDIANYFKDFREKRKELKKNPEKIKRILNEGSKGARFVAQETMKEVKEKVGLVL